MTLSDQITLIDDIVRKDPDFTIWEYLELVKEMDSISGTMEVPLIKHSKVEVVEATKKGKTERFESKYLRTYKIGS